MIRASLYLLAAGAIWLAEGIVFGLMLQFRAWQVTLLVILYGVLLGAAAWYLRQLRRAGTVPQDMARWRYLALAPAVAVVLGSFAALPLLMLVLVLGKVV